MKNKFLIFAEIIQKKINDIDYLNKLSNSSEEFVNNTIFEYNKFNKILNLNTNKNYKNCITFLYLLVYYKNYI